MARVQYSDSVKTIEGGYRVIATPTVSGMTNPKYRDIKSCTDFYAPLISAEFSKLGGAKDPFLDETIVLTHIYQESLFNSRANNSYPARGLGQFIPGTQKDVKIIDAYNYGDALPKIVTFVNNNFKAYKSVQERDLHMSLGVMAYFSGRRKNIEEFKRARDDLLNIDPLHYLRTFEVTYRRLGGQGFRTQW